MSRPKDLRNVGQAEYASPIRWVETLAKITSALVT